MTGPLVVLGVLSVVRRLAQPAGAAAARSGRRARALARAGRRSSDAARRPAARAEVVAQHRVRAHRRGGRDRASPASCSRSRGSSRRAWCRRRRRRRSRASSACSRNKYYVDELYDAAIVQPVGRRLARPALARASTSALIDGAARQRGTSAGHVRAAVSAWFGSQLQSGQVGTYAWVLVDRRARGARRLHSSADPMLDFLTSIGYEPLDPPGAPGDSAARRAASICVHGASTQGRRRRTRSRSAPRDVRRAASRCSRSLLEFVVSIGLWWVVRRRATPAGSSVVDLPWIPHVGHPLHARRRRHRGDDGAAHDVHHAARRRSAAGRACARKAHAYYALLLSSRPACSACSWRSTSSCST